jgi:hypothetical protein
MPREIQAYVDVRDFTGSVAADYPCDGTSSNPHQGCSGTRLHESSSAVLKCLHGFVSKPTPRISCVCLKTTKKILR